MKQYTRMPLSQERLNQLAQFSVLPTTQIETQTHTGRRVLIVDDSTDILEVLCTIFTEEGYSVATRPTFDEALAVLGAEPLDLFITDLRLPQGSGIELIRHVQQHMPTPPGIILLTAARYTPADEHEESMLTAMHVRLVAKPFDVDHLVNVVREMIGPGEPQPA